MVSLYILIQPAYTLEDLFVNLHKLTPCTLFLEGLF